MQDLGDKEHKGTNTFPTCSLALVAISSPLPNYSLSSHIRFFKENRANPARHHTLNTGQDHQAGSTSGQTTDPAPAMDSSHHKVIGVTSSAASAAAEGGRMCCVECRTTTTPMWRSGPTGPRSLCNACGIRYRKKRRQELGLDNKQQPHNQEHQQQEEQQEGQQHQQQQREDHTEATSAVKDSSSSNNKNSKLQVVKKRRVSMGVEEAAFLLMALSSSPSPTLLHG